MRVSPIPPLRGLATFYVEVFRNTPLTVVFFFMIFGLPQIDFVVGFFTGAVLSLGLYTAAFVCEAMRSGINAVSPGQAEAARAIGLTFGQSLREVVLPQAFRTVIPPLGNVFIAMVKNTSIAAGFAVSELSSPPPAAGQRRRRRAHRRPPRSGRRLHAHHAAHGLRRAPARATGGDPAMTAPVLFDIPGPKARARIRIGTVIGVGADPRRSSRSC